VFEQEQRIGDFACSAPGSELALKLPGVLVVDEAEPMDFADRLSAH
jgi:hypothetical protein